jgi:hypothetical protein
MNSNFDLNKSFIDTYENLVNRREICEKKLGADNISFYSCFGPKTQQDDNDASDTDESLNLCDSDSISVDDLRRLLFLNCIQKLFTLK